MKFKKSDLEKQFLNINGTDYPAVWTLGAMAEIEEITGLPHAQFLSKFADGTNTVDDLLALILAVLHAGGVEVEAADLKSCRIDEADLFEQLGKIISAGSAGESKNLKKAK